jgi:hypothetical protein
MLSVPPKYFSESDHWLDNKVRRAQDEAFCDAMDIACRSGLEHPPMIGVDTRPCTKNPMPLMPRKT